MSETIVQRKKRKEESKSRCKHLTEHYLSERLVGGDSPFGDFREHDNFACADCPAALARPFARTVRRASACAPVYEVERAPGCADRQPRLLRQGRKDGHSFEL